MTTKSNLKTAAKTKLPGKPKSAAKAQPKSAPKPGANANKPSSGIEPGALCPDFTLETAEGKLTRASLKGAPFVLYFYPKDDTTGCTKEACAFRDQHPAFKKLKARIIGVSRDDLKSHGKFAAKYDLPFTLGSDEDGSVCAAFGVWVEKSMYGRKYMGIERSTFLVDGKGVIRNAWRKVDVTAHADEVFASLKELGG